MDLETLSHTELLTVLFGGATLFAGGIGWAISRLWAEVRRTNERIEMIRSDHVTRAEFEAHRSQVYALAQSVAAIKARQADDRRAFSKDLEGG